MATQDKPAIYLGQINVDTPTDTYPTPIVEPSSMPNLWLALSLSKASFFSDAIDFIVQKDASGVVINVTASLTPQNNVDAEYLLQQLELSSTSWSSPSVFNLEYTIDGLSRNIPYSVSQAEAIFGGSQASFGLHVAALASTAIKLNQTNTVDAVFDDPEDVKTSIDGSIASSIASHIAKPEMQDIIFQRILQINGPVIDVSESSGSLIVTEDMTDMVLSLVLNGIRLRVNFNGIVRYIVLNQLPIRITLE